MIEVLAQLLRLPWRRMLPGFSLMLLAPLIAEVLPGATRLSAIFVLPIEIVVWGGAAVMIREAVRRLNLGWRNLLLLALALALAEECLIQQTSLAPVVIKLEGEEYARAGGVNYIYLLWAVIYETTFVVLIPIALAELIFVNRRREPWLSATGAAAIVVLFVPGCLLAWFTWTHIARTEVFHLPMYTPPRTHVVIAAVAILALIVAAVGPLASRLKHPSRPLAPPYPAVLALLAAVAVVVLFFLEVLAFGIAPKFPPLIAMAIGLNLIVASLAIVPRFCSHPAWSSRHTIGLLYGAIYANMAIFFIAFIGSTPLDFYGKVVLDLLAAILLAWFAKTRLAQPSAA